MIPPSYPSSSSSSSTNAVASRPQSSTPNIHQSSSSNDPRQIMMSGHSNGNANPSHNLSNRGGNHAGFEEIDDPTEYIKNKPIQSFTSSSISNQRSNINNPNHPLSSSSSTAGSNQQNRNGHPSTSSREPSSSSNSNSANGKKSSGRLKWDGEKWVERVREGAGKVQHSTSGGEQHQVQYQHKDWIRPSSQSVQSPTESIPMIGGSGARVPTELLDRQGNFSKQSFLESLNSGSRGSSSSSSNLPSASSSSNQAPYRFHNQTQAQLQQQYHPRKGSMSSSGSLPPKSQPESIDLTGDDSPESEDQDVIITGSSSNPQSASRQQQQSPHQPQPRRSHSQSSSSHPHLPPARFARPSSNSTPEIQVDEARSNGPVCIGIIQAMVLCLFGLPNVLTYDGNKEAVPPEDTSYHRSNWPGVSHFWTATGYRPVLLALSDHPPSAHQRSANSNSTVGGRDSGQIRVSPVLSPMANAKDLAARGQPIHPSQPPLGPRILPSFGILAEKFSWALDPLLRSGMIKCEARCAMAPTTMARNSINMHPLELLVFTTRPSVPLVSEQLARVGIRLEHPAHLYQPQDYPGHPEYSNPHGNSITNAFRNFNQNESRVYNPGVGGFSGTVIQTKPLSEEEKKKQVESVYFNLKSGTDLELTDQSQLIKTPLFDHQRQALTFILDRERERSFDEIDIKSLETSEGSKENRSSKSKGKQRANNQLENPDANGIVSLWKPVRQSNGKITSYLNVVTQTEYKEEPVLCRGSLLADDMGLGKTITIIALIAHTIKESKEWERTKLEPPVIDVDEEEDDQENGNGEKRNPEDFNLAMFGAPTNKKSKGNDGVKRGGKRQAKRKDEERLRRKNLERKSRATLIVAPLSVVSNWEEQFKEHWSDRDRPSILIYHGAQRSGSVEFIANHDVVISTYSTLGVEFSNQQAWIQPGQESDGESGADDDEEIISIDAEGNAIKLPAIQSASKIRAKEAKKKRKRKFAEGKEHKNPLQRIEWFRIVLDEAHTIKEASTWQSRAVSNLSAQRRTSVTGTPVQNRLDDLFAQLRFLRLDPFSDKATWTQYCGQKQHNVGLRSKKNTDDEPVDAMCLARVQTIVKFLTLRRTKDMKLANGKPLISLPPKTSRMVHLEFNEHERAKYRAMQSRYKEDFQEMIAGDTVSANYATILHEILNLRLSCCHSALVDASKDVKRGKDGGGGGGPSAAIRDDGITRDRAVDLFLLLRDSEQASCIKCNTDLSSIADGAGGSYLPDNADELDGALRTAMDDKKGKGRKKSGAGSRTPKSGGAGLATPSDDALKAVLTKCQHLFCSTCFSESVGDSWPNPKAGDKALCPACGDREALTLSLLLEVVELGPQDFSAGDEINAPLSPVHESFDWQSQGKEESKDQDFNAMNGELSFFDLKAPDLGMMEGVGASQDTSNSISLEGRTDLSSKIKALIEDLIPFSRCNPRSKLYNPTAPILSHEVITEEEKKPEPDQMNTDNQEAGAQSSSQATVQVVETPPHFDENGQRVQTTLPVKSVVFSQWTTMLDRISKSLKLTGIKFARLDGAMARAHRATNLIQFKEDDEIEVLLVSIRAGGTGLNLVTACRAYLMDPYWNPAVEEQALDRIHRWGQKQGVITTKFIVKNTIEANMLKLQRRKMMLAQAVGGDRPKNMSADEKKKERVEELKLLFGEDIGE